MFQKKRSEYHVQNVLRTSLVMLALLFSFFLMFHTFSYDTRDHTLHIGSKLWSDFGAHIPLIRSFSHGPNLIRFFHHQAIESPLYPGEPIRYHFGFYALVGMLERLGLPLDWAVNIPSALGLTLLLVAIYTLALKLFKNHSVAVLSVLFFLFNGSLSFINFFATHPLSLHTVQDIITNSRFPSFGPWDGGDITAFWNLNIYTNQRHLALSYGLVLSLIILIAFPSASTYTHRLRTSLVCAAIMSVLLFINFPSASIALLILFWIGIVKKESRWTLFYAAIFSLPAFLWLQGLANVTQHITFQPGYLVHMPHTVWAILSFWWQNLGLHLFLIPLGILLSPRPMKRLIVPPLVILFLLPNLFRFSPDMINNHKFINLVIIIGSMFSAYAIVMLTKRIKYIGKFFAFILILCVTLSGIIDFFPIINDYKGILVDSQNNPDIQYFEQHTEPRDIIANSTWFYHPASLAGRAILSGYTYFTWSYGYDQTQREASLIEIYEAKNITALCSTLAVNHVSYVELSTKAESYLHPNLALWNSLPSTYTNKALSLFVYKTSQICP